MKASKYSQFMGKSDLSRHPVNGKKQSSKKWVAQRQIQPILKKLKDYVKTINANRKSILEMSKILNSMEFLVNYNNSSKKTLPQLYYEFWNDWNDFKRILLQSIQPENFCSQIRTQLSKATDILYASEKNYPDDKYDDDKFQYVYNKISIIYESLQGIPDIHNCKRIFTVVAQNYESFFTDQNTAEKFLKKIRHCIKTIQGVFESSKQDIDLIQESENQFIELVPLSLTVVRGKSVSQKRCYETNKSKNKPSKGPPSFVSPIITDLSPQARTRTTKHKFGTSPRARSVAPIKSSFSYASISGSARRYDNSSNYGDFDRNFIDFQNVDRRSVSGSSSHRGHLKH